MPEQHLIDWEPIGAPPSRRPRHMRLRANRASAIGASLLVAGLISSFAVAAPGGSSDQPLRAEGSRSSPLLRVTNDGEGRAGVMQCAGAEGKGCLFVRNTGDGPAARFATKAGVAPFRLPLRSGKVPNLNADLLDGLGAEAIIREALERSAGGREPSGPAGGDLTGTFPNPTLGAGSIDTLELFTTDLRNGDADSATLRSLGTGAQQAAAGDDPRFTAPGPPSGAAGGDLTGSFPNPTLAADSIDSLTLFGAQVLDGPAPSATLRSLGNGAQQAAAGNDPRLSNARTPTGTAGGDLAGTYPNPTLSAGSIDATSLFANSLQDGAAATPTLRSLGTGANQAVAGNDARLSNARTPTGAAGGDLTGSYPDPTIDADAIGGAEVADGSLRLGDLAVFGSSFSVNASLGANTCGVLEANLTGIIDIQDGDIIEVYQRVDDFPSGVILTGGTQNADELVRINVCNNSPSTANINGAGAPFRIYR